jgi:methionyl aminopeptidase
MFLVGNVSDKVRKLCEVTKQAMEAGIRQCGPGVPVKNVGKVLGFSSLAACDAWQSCL